MVAHRSAPWHPPSQRWLQSAKKPDLSLVAPQHHCSAEVADGTLASGLPQVILSVTLLQFLTPWLPLCLISAPSSTLRSLS